MIRYIYVQVNKYVYNIILIYNLQVLFQIYLFHYERPKFTFVIWYQWIKKANLLNRSWVAAYYLRMPLVYESREKPRTWELNSPSSRFTSANFVTLFPFHYYLCWKSWLIITLRFAFRITLLKELVDSVQPMLIYLQNLPSYVVGFPYPIEI